MKKIELEIVALSQSVTQTQSYAVVLGDLEGTRRIPIVIGSFEAQSIAVAIEKMKPSRPITHDLMKDLCDSFNIEVVEVLINNLSDGIFYSKLICQHGDKTIEIDSRTSDALAIAVRFDCPIFTYDFILDSAGIALEEGEEKDKVVDVEGETEGDEPKESKQTADIATSEVDDLKKLMEEALANEDYEEAARLRDEIKKREER